MEISSYIWIAIGVLAFIGVREWVDRIIIKRAHEFVEEDSENDCDDEPIGYCAEVFNNAELSGEDVRRMVNEGLDPTICSTHGYTPLFYEHKPDAIEALYEAGVNPHAVDKNGWNMIHHMAAEDCGAEPLYARATVELAQRCGLDINARTNNNEQLTPLAMALNEDEGSADIARLLLEFGADPNKTSFFEEEDDDGNEQLVECSPLQRCRRYTDLMLVAAGADTSQTDTEWSPLQLATARGQALSVNECLEAGADADDGGDIGYTPIEIAAFFNHVDILKSLVAKASGFNKDEALYMAAWYGSADALNYLIELGADIEHRTYGLSPLMTICERQAESPCNAEGYFKSAEILLKAGANPNATHISTAGKHTWITTPLNCTLQGSTMRKILIAGGATNEGGKQ